MCAHSRAPSVLQGSTVCFLDAKSAKKRSRATHGQDSPHSRRLSKAASQDKPTPAVHDSIATPTQGVPKAFCLKQDKPRM